MLLNSQIIKEFRLNEQQKTGFKKLGLETIKDLLFYFPNRYGDLGSTKSIVNLVVGEEVTLVGEIKKLQTTKGWKSKVPMSKGILEDSSGKIKIVWFNQPYIAKMIPEGTTVKVSGKIMARQNELYLSNPKIEILKDFEEINTSDSLFGKEMHKIIHPIYKETKGISSNWLYHAIKKIIQNKVLDQIEDYLPEEILKKYHLPNIKNALIWIHLPKEEKFALNARKRFAFEEVFFIQLERQFSRNNYQQNKSFKIDISEKEINNFTSRFPFSLTKSQNKAIAQIKNDINKEIPMTRLLEGDVGSGKTAVAASITYATILNRPPKTPDSQVFGRSFYKEKDLAIRQNFGNLQVAYMAPTEILANQHFESFINYFAHLPINIGLITSSGCKKFPSKVSPDGWTNISRPQLLKWLANGEIPILIGTHSLIQKTVKFKNLALAIIDEQHRFGVKQRSGLAKKDEFVPHLLSMTATPIPRTLALTIYGDLDLTLLEEMPSGRKQIITEIVTPNKRNFVYEKIKEEMNQGRQLYVICPRIDEPDPEKALAIIAKSVTAEASKLKREIFPNKNIATLHSKMTREKKEKIMEEFSLGKIDILVATSVVEVGVNVPNATIIIIEGAERFGLAQLHQLRGRVLRSNHQAYCYIFAETKSEKTIARLNAIKNAKNGFELSELDLKLRGAGEISGNKQWGLTDLAMEAIKNIKMVEAARNEAICLVKEDSEFKKYPQLKKVFEQKRKNIHFE